MLREAGRTAPPICHKFTVLIVRVRLNNTKRQMNLTHNFPFLCQAVLDSNAGCGTLRFVVVDAIYFSFFSKGRVTCDESCICNYS